MHNFSSDVGQKLQPGTSVQPAVRQVVAALRADSLAMEPGTLMGQEDELLARYKISRPTLRQAAALVGQEQLVRVRRGVGGGYFSHRPDVSSVTHMAAIILQLAGTSLDAILRSTETIRLTLIPLAANSQNEDVRSELREFLERDESTADDDYDFVTFLRAERRHNDIIGRASGNPVLHLYMQISLDLASSLSKEESLLFGKRGRVLEWRDQRNNMLRAVLNHDPEIALIEARRCSEKIRKWLHDDQMGDDTRNPKLQLMAGGFEQATGR